MSNFKGIPIPTFVKLSRAAEAAAERQDEPKLHELGQQLAKAGYTLYVHKSGGQILARTLILRSKRR